MIIFSASIQRLEVAWVYTINGQGVIYTYSGFGEVKTEQITMGTSRTLQYRYDKHSNRTRVTHPDTQRYFTYGYDQLDRLVNIKETGNDEVITRSYRTQGTPYQTRRHNNQNNVTQYDYDDINRLTDLDWLQNSTTFNARDFTYNRASQVESVSTSNHNLVYQGNHNLTGTWQANGLNQISNIAGQTYTWDGNANLESDGSTTYTYDRENRLTSATGAKNITLTYDPLGRLHTTTANNVTTTFLYSGDALVAEYQGATLTKVYVHGAGTDDPLIEYTTGAMNDTSRRYLHKDHQGSIVGISDSGGNVTAYNTYDAFGIPHQSNQGRFSYTGQIYLPELQMYHYKARVYDPKLGRFLQTDPVGYEDQMNLYAYVGNDPMNFVDPTGLCQQENGQPKKDCSENNEDDEEEKDEMERIEVTGTKIDDIKHGDISIEDITENSISDDQSQCLTYGQRYMNHLDKHLVNVGPYAVALAGGAWPKSWSPKTGGRPALLGSKNPLTSVPRAFGLPGAKAPLVRGGAAAIGVATVGIGFYNVGTFGAGAFYAIPSHCN